MGAILERGERIVVQWVDGAGRKRQRTVRKRRADGRPLSPIALRGEARRLLAELEDLAERQRAGLAPRPRGATTGVTFGDLEDFYGTTRGAGLRSPTFAAWCSSHLVRLRRMPAVDVTTAVVDRLLGAKLGELSEKSVKHIRGHLNAIFEAARVQGGPWEGRPNPVPEARQLRPPEKSIQVITPAEWPLLEPHIFARWRTVAKVAFFTGLRRGDVFGLRKADVDLEHQVLNATISKGKKARRLPIHDDLVADLERQLATPGAYLFAWDRTKRLPNLVKMLRRACGRAGLVTGHELRCRRRAACGWTEERGGVQPPPIPDACPSCGHDSVYARPVPRKVRFHDLRHSFGTAVVAAGGTGAGQALLAHSDPRMTAKYTHLAEDLLGGVVARAFDVPRAAPGLQPVPGLGSPRVLAPAATAFQSVGPPGLEPGRRFRGRGF